MDMGDSSILTLKLLESHFKKNNGPPSSRKV